MTRLFILTTLIVGAGLMASCSGAVVQPTATTQSTAVPAQPTAAPPQPTKAPTTVAAPLTATTQPTATPVQPTATTQPTKASTTPTSQASASGQQKLNLDDYLPKGVGRELMLRDCTSCHSFVPVVTGQRPNDRWLSLKNDHKDKAPSVSEADYNTEFAYLMENFNNNKPEPKFPDWFMALQQGIGE